MACTSRAAAAVPAAAAAAGSRQQRRRAAVAAAPVSSGRRAAIFEAAKLAGVALTASTAAPLAARAEDDGGLFNEFGSTNPLKNPFTPVAAIGLSLLTAMSLLGDKKADKVKEELMEQYGIETEGVREVKFCRGQQIMLEKGQLTPEEVQANFAAEARKIAQWLDKPVPAYAQEK